jgi:hypothetical protein
MARSVSWARRLADARILSDDLAELARLLLEAPKPRRKRPARPKRAAQAEGVRNG